VISGASLLIYWTGFGSRRSFDAVLRLRAAYDEAAQTSLGRVLGRHCRGYTMVNMRDIGGALQEQSYQIRLTNRSEGGALLRDLAGVKGIEGPSLLMQESMLEV
jgi:hypothetical protein